MGMVKAKTRGARNEGNPTYAVRGNNGRTFFRSAVDIARNHLAMPVHQLRRISIVVNINGHALTFYESQQRPGKLPIIKSGRHDMLGRQLDEPRGNPQRVVRFSHRRLGALSNG